MRQPSTSAKLSAWAGFTLGGTVWAVNTELGQLLPPLDCVNSVSISAVTSFAAAVIVLASAAVSWRLNGDPSVGDDRSLPFASKLSALAALVFTFALLMQGTASLVLTGCEH